MVLSKKRRLTQRENAKSIGIHSGSVVLDKGVRDLQEIVGINHSGCLVFSIVT